MRERNNRRSDNNQEQSADQRIIQIKRQFFKRRKSCPFSGTNPMTIDYKDIRTLSKFVSERGKMMPSRVSAVSAKKQRELSVAIKRARYLALMPYVNN
ncbi:MAG: 30S ribosomal protein S18 [Proteobacteria bacterium]|nr:30S ribosomal protein S18 [Pseudomonadota bacterium]